MYLDDDGKWQPTVTITGIYGFFGKYRFLSNFEKCDINYKGILYPSSEHLYMALKTTDEKLRKEISEAPTPAAAGKIGRSIELRPEWDKLRIPKMRKVLLEKFTQNPEQGSKLLKTGIKYLEETNYWGDTFWGACHPKVLDKSYSYDRDKFKEIFVKGWESESSSVFKTGFNNLGCLLMETRVYLRQKR